MIVVACTMHYIAKYMRTSGQSHLYVLVKYPIIYIVPPFVVLITSILLGFPLHFGFWGFVHSATRSLVRLVGNKVWHTVSISGLSMQKTLLLPLHSCQAMLHEPGFVHCGHCHSKAGLGLMISSTENTTTY